VTAAPAGRSRLHRAAALAIALSAVLPVAFPCIADAQPEQGAAISAGDGGARQLRATIMRTRYGIPHIRARNFSSLGFGYGYALAEDNICTLADRYLTVRAQRSRFLGPNGSWEFTGNTTVNNNLLSDFYHRWINRSRTVERLIRRRPPHGPAPEVKALVRGHVAGYNLYLRRTGVDRLPDPRCRGEAWVRPIREIDVYRHFFQIASLASSGAAIEGIAGARPLVGASAAEAEARRREALDDLGAGELELNGRGMGIGSNAFALGGRATPNSRGMLLGNPHFPWDGGERLYQAHLIIPGTLDVAGATLYGAPLILIGHTRSLAWSHTVGTPWRFTFYELTLVPGDPHSYLLDGRVTPMKATTVRVKARTPDGELETRAGTIHETRWGPVFTEIIDLPLFPWTPLKAFALADVNAQNFRYLNHFLRTNRAQSVRRYDRIGRRIQGIPWVASVAADRAGRAYFSMDGAIPNVPDSKAVGCAGASGLAVFDLTGIPVLDGSRSRCGWDDDPDAVAPGILGPAEIPRLFRRDYVHNANDSHWLTNPERPLEGFERIVGDERTERSLRTRIGLIMLQDRLAGTDGLSGRRFTLGQMTRMALGNRHYTGELWRDELVALCEASPVLTGSDGPVNVSDACPILEAWNLRDDLGSNGAILFRRFASNLLGNFQYVPTGVSAGQYPGREAVFDRPFSPTDPVHTPRGLDTSNPLVGQALADAVDDLRGAGIPLDAPLLGHQLDVRGGKRIPIHGGPGDLGVFNAINVEWTPNRGGYPNVPHGTSFLTAISFRDGRCPVAARTFVAYGQSENERSPHAADYTRAFSRKEWNDVPFCRFEIRRDPELKVTRIASPRP
jgi:acyl-homoserine-lactone acylase